MKDKHVAATGVDNALRRNLDILKIKDFVPHDLRRTAATYMSSMGTSRLVISKILNHAEQSITAIYDRHSYDKEKRQALNMWARKLDSILKDKWANRQVKA